MRISLTRLLLLALVAAASAQFGGPKRPKKKAPVRKDDLKYIRCQVCEAIAKQSRSFLKELQEKAGPKKVPEGDILEKLEKMCDPDQDEGDWITQIEVVEEGAALKLRDTGLMGKCKSECRTIAYTCDKIMDDIDLTELSSMIFSGQKRAALLNWLCREYGDACEKKPPPVPKDRPVGERHTPMDEEEIRNIKMMRNMASAGLSGSMYSRDMLQDELADISNEYGDDPDFMQMMKDSGMDNYVPKPEPDLPRSAEELGAPPAAGAAADAHSILQETAAKAADAIKEVAAKVMEGARNFVGNLFGGGKKQEAGKEL